MNFIDRTVLFFSPERGERRIKARLRSETTMNYDAASRGRRTEGWRATGTSADAAAGANRGRLRNLSRDMIRNRPYAFRLREVVTTNVVGTGVMPSVDIDDRDRASEVMEVIKAHLMTTAIDAYGVSSFPALQKQVMNTVFSDGEVLVRRRMRTRKYNPDLPLFFQIQLMEADYLDTRLTTWGKNEVIDGIEYGPTGVAEAYHLFDEHPGADTRRLRSLKSTRVPAGQILHIRRIDRAGQMRGVPWLAPVMMTLGELSDYQEAQILKQRMAALMALVIESEADGTKFKGAGLEQLAPGAVVGLEPGQTGKFSEPPTVNGYDQFMKTGLSAIAMGVGVTYESVSGDLSGVNFSSGRMGRMEMDRMVEVTQQQIMIAQLCDGVSKWALDVWRMQRLGSNLPEPPDAIGWTAPRRPLIDPGKEIKAAKDEVEAGFSSRQRKQRELGYDPDTIANERAEDARRDAEAGNNSAPSGSPEPGNSDAPGND